MIHVDPKNIDVLLLCGGLGKGIRSVVNDRPKSMADINGRPFLDILIGYVANFGFRRFILCIGYMGDVIKRYYQGRESSLEIIFSEEETPLGTGGAIKNAESLIKSSPFLVMNGDSFCRVDLRKFLKFHLNKNAYFSIVITNAKKKKANAYGVVALEDSQQVIEFNEKVKCNGDIFINVGIYLFQPRILSLMPRRQNFSLEKDFLSKIINKENIYGYITSRYFIDIGTPERYKKAKQIFFRNIDFGIQM